jgi:PPM family protein phosphatase
MNTELQGADTVDLVVPQDPFARHFGPSPPPVDVRFGAQSHTGRVRSSNEDHYLIVQRRRTRTVLATNLPEGFLPPADDIAYVYGVADGIGGASFGELASALALRSAWEQAPGTIKWTWIINDREIEELKERVELIFQRMQQTLVEQGRTNPRYAGMGTTLTAAYTVGPEAFVGHVGDSRAYLYHARQLTQVTRDHTLAQDCLDAGLPVPCRSWHHRLTNCLGANDAPLHVEFHHLRLADDDQVLLCTDGLTDMVSDEEIAQVLGRDAHPRERTSALIDRALERGGKDNVTVVLAQYAMKHA